MSDDKPTTILTLDQLMELESQGRISRSAKDADEAALRHGMQQLQLRLAMYEANLQEKIAEHEIKISELQSARDEHRLVIQALVATGAITQAQCNRIERTVEDQGKAAAELKRLYDEQVAELSSIAARLTRVVKQQGLLVELAKTEHDFETR